MTPESPKQAEIDTQNLPDDPAEIVAVWPEVPEHTRAAIRTLIQIHHETSKEQQKD